MICTKCNSEIPDGAKFCTVCGAAYGQAADVKPAAPPQAPENKCFCAKCGLELQYGAKFCAVCGAPAGNVGNITPTASDIPTTPGQGQMPPVSLEKEPTPNDLVAAMNNVGAPAAPTASAAPTATPESYNSGFSAPGVPMPVGSDMGGGYAAPAPEAPTYAPSPNANGVPQYGAVTAGVAGAAAAVAQPAKKKRPKVGLIIGIVLGAIVIAAGVLFLVNRSFFLSLFMGKPRYAAMIEKDSVKSAVEQIDTKQLSADIRSLSTVFSSASNIASSGLGSSLTDALGGPLDISDILGSLGGGLDSTGSLGSLGLFRSGSAPANFVRIMTMNKGSAAVDLSSLASGKSIKDIYGTSGASVKINANIVPGEKLLEEAGITSAAAEIGNYLKDLNIGMDIVGTEDIFGSLLTASVKGETVDLKTIVKDNKLYVMLPFASDKALSLTLPEDVLSGITTDVNIAEMPALELDEKELDRLINDIVDIYIKYYKESEVTMESGSLTIAGTTVEGKQIQATLDGTKLTAMLKDMLHKILGDSYISTKLSEFVKSLGLDGSVDEALAEINAEVDKIPDLGADNKIIITTIINNSGKELAKAYRFDISSAAALGALGSAGTAGNEYRMATGLLPTAGGISGGSMQGPQIAYFENENAAGYDFSVMGFSVLTVNVEKTSKTDGKITATAGMGSQLVDVIVEYSGVGEAAFGNLTVPVGSYSVKINTDLLPEIRDFSLKFGTEVNGSTMKSDFSMSLPGYLDAMDISAETTLSDDLISKFEIPSNAINMDSLLDLEAILSGSAPNPDIDEETMQQLSEFVEEILKSNELANFLNDLDLEELIGSIMGGGGMSGPASGDDILTPPEPEDIDDPDDWNNENPLYTEASALENEIWNEAYGVFKLLDDYGVFSGTAYEAAMQYQDKLSALDNEFWDIMINPSELTSEIIETYRVKFNEILKEKNAVIEELKKAAEAGGNAETPEEGGLEAGGMAPLPEEAVGA